MAQWKLANNATTGALGNNTWWFDPVGGQSFYDAGAATNGTMDTAFWTAFGWGRFMARQAIDSAHFHTLSNGTLVELDGVLVPNGRDGTGGDACAAVPSFAGYPIASVAVGLDGFSTPFGLCIYGRQFGEAKLVKVASAMEDLFGWAEKPRWFNYDTAKGPGDASWPGFTCSSESLDRGACERAR